MTDIGASGGTGGGGQRRWVAPTDPHLTTALTQRLGPLANNLTREWGRNQVNALPGRLAALPPQRRTVWQGLLEAWTALLLKDVMGGLANRKSEAVAEAIRELKATQYVHHGLDDRDIDPAITGGAGQILDNYLGATALFAAISKGLEDLTPQVDERIGRFVRLEPWLDDRVKTCQASYAALQPLLDEANDALALADQYKLTEALQVVIAPLANQRDAAAAALARTLPLLWVDLDKALGDGFQLTEAEQQRSLEAVIGKAVKDADTAALQLGGMLWLLTEDVLNVLKPLATMASPVKTGYTELVQTYKVPFIRCMSAIEEPVVMKRVLGHFAQLDVRGAFRAQFTAPCTLAQLSKGFHELQVNTNTQDACIGLNNLTKRTNITVPKSVTPHTWIAIGTVWVPRAFSVGDLETDLLCLKHMVEELGLNPSPAKCVEYFAELVGACVAAGEQWRSARKPASLSCEPIKADVAVWNIKVRLAYGKPQIFHVDSGYSKASPWVKR